MNEFEKSVPAAWREALVDWAENEPLIRTVHVYGSVIKGCRHPDDLDVAVTLAVKDYGEITSLWIHKRSEWEAQLQSKIGLTVDLQLDHDAPKVRAGLEEASVLIFERSG